MENLERLLQEIHACLPPPGTVLGDYTFLSPDALWTGTMCGQPFAAVAEDRWNASGSGQFLAVLERDGVFVADLKTRTAVNYCAASFPQFMRITELYEAALEETPYPKGVSDEEGYRRLEEAEQVLRKKVASIDRSALAGENHFWSTWIEEFGYGL